MEQQQQKHQGWCEGVGEEFSRMASRLGPSDQVQSHFRTARVEFLKGLRALIDESIEKAQRAQQKPSKGATIVVD